MKTYGFRIEICGGIATGKTTLAERIVRNHGGSLLLEDFRSNPFWKRFYERPQLFFREKNICFLAQHAGDIKAMTGSDTVCDYAVVQDLAYASLSGDAEHQAAMEHLYTHLYVHQPAPQLIVHLLCDEAVQLQRIQRRGRSEEDAITVHYLRRLNEALKASLISHSPGCPVLEVRSDNVDFANDPMATHALTKRLRGLLMP